MDDHVHQIHGYLRLIVRQRDMMVTSMVFRNKRHNCPVSRLPYGYRHNGRLTMVVPVTILWQLIMDTTVVSLVS